LRERDAAAAPGQLGEPADFQNEIAMFLAEMAQLAPVVYFEAGNDGVLWKRRRIDDPGVRDYLLKFQPVPFAELAPPEIAERPEPEKSEPHFFFEEWFDRR